MFLSKSHPLEKSHVFLECACMIPSLCPGIVGAAGGKHILWVKVVEDAEGQLLGCQSIMFPAAGELSSAFSWLSHH